MPKSRRNKVVSLSTTTKKGYEKKEDLVARVQKSCDEYASIYVFSIDNMRNQKMKGVRQKWQSSRFFFGKNRVMAIALGKTKENEYKDNLHELSERLKGDVAIMFTNKEKEDVLKWFDKYSEEDYARSGCIASSTVKLPAGDLDQDTYPHSMEPSLRKLGLPTALIKGIVNLSQEYIVCKEGDTLTPDQCTILKLFFMPMVKFHLELKCAWHSDGTFEEF